MIQNFNAKNFNLFLNPNILIDTKLALKNDVDSVNKKI
jgi:hypothetical protein